MSPLVSSMCWNPKGVGSKASDGVDLQEQGQPSKELPQPLYRLLRGGVAQT